MRLRNLECAKIHNCAEVLEWTQELIVEFRAVEPKR